TSLYNFVPVIKFKLKHASNKHSTYIITTHFVDAVGSNAHGQDDPDRRRPPGNCRKLGARRDAGPPGPASFRRD
ncbi:hypothetical protein pipiens_013408, partial [Culex pipiens pipiens]